MKLLVFLSLLSYSLPTVVPTPIPSPTPTLFPTPTPTLTSSPTPVPTPFPTALPTKVPSLSPTSIYNILNTLLTLRLINTIKQRKDTRFKGHSGLRRLYDIEYNITY